MLRLQLSAVSWLAKPGCSLRFICLIAAQLMSVGLAAVESYVLYVD